MNGNTIPVIKKTTHYSDFKTVKGNRLLYKDHFNSLLEAVKTKNLLYLNPIIVNGQMQVVDGQHRLAVAEKLNEPIYYVQGNGLTIEDVIMFNTAVKDWSIEDYTQTYIKLGYAEYQKLADFQKKWKFSTSNSIAILSGDGKVVEAKYKKYKKGLFEIPNWDWANRFAKCLHDITPYTNGNTWKDRDFIKALSTIYSKGVDHEALIERLQRYPTPIYRRANMTEYLRVFEDVYNTNQPGKPTRFY